jgi:hypothetical protein
MSNSIKRFKDDIENIEVPKKELEKAINIGIDRGTTKKFPAQKLMYSSSVAVVIMALLLGSGFVSPAMAKVLSEIPYLGSVLPYSDKGLKVADEKGLIKSIGETSVDQGIPITVTDVYYDHSRLEIGYYIPLEDVDVGGVDELGIIGISELEIYLDGTRATGYGASNDYKEDYIVGTFNVTDDFSQLPENPTIQIQITEVLGKQGQWLFEFETERVQDQINIEINESAQTDTLTFTVKEMEVTPSTTKINYELQIPANPNLIDFNPYSLVFTLFGVNGDPLELIKTGNIYYEHTEDVTIMSSELYYEPIAETSRNMTVVPSIKSTNEGNELDTAEFNMRIQLTD